MQIKPSTAKSEFKTPGWDLFDPYVNITVGVKYLRQLHDRFGDWNTALTGYSHGPTITDTYSKSYINSNSKGSEGAPWGPEVPRGHRELLLVGFE